MSAVALAAICGACSAQTPAPAAPPLTFATSGDAEFDSWRTQFAARALREGRQRPIVSQMLTGLTPEGRVIDFDRRQPEFVSPVWDYINTRVAGSRITAGRDLKAAIGPVLTQVEARYGVDQDIILGIWGLESNFGAAALPHDAPRAIATLAYEGRRRAQFETYLLALIEMVERGYAGPNELKSSWAGALGQPQFMPDAYLSTAVDWDGDGHRDIWNNRGDVAASIANYLKTRGWQANQAVFDEVRLPTGFNLTLADTTPRTVADWEARGVRRADGTPWSASDRAMQSELFLPAGATGPVLLLHPNFSVIRRYNASDRYALSVALLARAYEGRGGLVTPWPTHLGTLQRDDMMQLQILLSNLGYNAGTADGQFGSNTRRAVAAFQTAEGMAPDGFPTADLLRAVRLKAGIDVEPTIREADLPRARALDTSGVRDLQRRLTRLGYTPGPADGSIGERTRAAIRAFERDKDITVTGRATTRVLEAVRRAQRS
ncbi:MAG: lytic murein transglycosylase [Caulobacterales bacterium]